MNRSFGVLVITSALLLTAGVVSPAAGAQPARPDGSPPPAGLSASPSKGTKSASAPPTCTPTGTPSVVSAQAGIAPVANRKPVASNQTVAAVANGSTTFRLKTGDPDNDALVYRIDDAPDLGQLSGNAPDLRYSTTATSGTDSFAYTAWDGQFGVSGVVTITIGGSAAASSSATGASPIGPSASTRAASPALNAAELQEFDRYLITVPQCASATDVTSYRIFAFDLLDRGSQATPANHAPADVDAAVTLDVSPGQTTATVLVPRRGIPVRFRVSARNSKGAGPTTGASGYAVAPFTSISAFVDDAAYRFRSPWAAADRAATKTTWGDPWSYRVGTPAPTAQNLIATLNDTSPLTKGQAPIVRLYMAYFGRMPDVGGLDYWVRKYTTAPVTSLRAISSQFAGSSEFAPYRSLSNTAFVKKVYEDVMGRTADSGGLAYWTGKLNAKKIDRGGVMLNFSDSSENVRNARGYVDLTTLYRQMLGRVPSNEDPGADLIAPVPTTSNDSIRASFRNRAIRTIRGLPGYTNGPLRVVTSGLIPGEVGTSYPDVRLDSIGGTANGTRTWTLTSGALPGGLSLTADGRLSGTPTAAGTFPLVFRVAAGSASATSAVLTLRVDPAPPGDCSNPAGLDRYRWTGAAGDGNWETAGNWVHTPSIGSVATASPGGRVPSDPLSLASYAGDTWFAPTYPPPGEIQGASIDPEVVTVGSVPAYDDYVCIPAFTPPVTLDTNGMWDVALAQLDNFGTLTVPIGTRLDLNGGPDFSLPSTSGGTLTVGGVLSGRGSLTIRPGATMTWHGNCTGAGAMTTRRANQYRIDTSLVAPHLAGRTIVAAGATVFIGVASGPPCSHPQGINFGDERILINDGTIRVRGTAYVAADHGTRLDNFGAFEFAGAGATGDVEGRWVEGYGSGYPGLLGTSRISNSGTIDKVSGNGRAILAGSYVRPAGTPDVEGTVTSGSLDVLSTRFEATVSAGTSFSTGGCSYAGVSQPCPSPQATSSEQQVEVVTRPASTTVAIERLPQSDLVWGFPIELTTATPLSAAAPLTLDLLIDTSLFSGSEATLSNVQVYYLASPVTPTSTPKILSACPVSPTALDMPCYTNVEKSTDADPQRNGDLIVTIKTDENSGYGAGRKRTLYQLLRGYRRCGWYRPRC